MSTFFFEPKLFLTILHMKGYNAFRELCGLKRVASIDYLVDLIPAKIVDRLKLIYDNVDDIDLFIGGISELPAPGWTIFYFPQNPSNFKYFKTPHNFYQHLNMSILLQIIKPSNSSKFYTFNLPPCLIFPFWYFKTSSNFDISKFLQILILQNSSKFWYFQIPPNLDISKLLQILIFQNSSKFWYFQIPPNFDISKLL